MILTVLFEKMHFEPKIAGKTASNSHPMHEKQQAVLLNAPYHLSALVYNHIHDILITQHCSPDLRKLSGN